MVATAVYSVTMVFIIICHYYNITPEVLPIFEQDESNFNRTYQFGRRENANDYACRSDAEALKRTKQHRACVTEHLAHATLLPAYFEKPDASIIPLSLSYVSLRRWFCSLITGAEQS